MVKTIFLSTIYGANGMFEAEALRCGKWAHPEAANGEFEITPTVLSEMARNFKRGAKGYEVELNLDHGAPCGWVKDVRLSDDGTSLFALFEVTEPSVLEKVQNQTIKFTSSEIDLNWLDPEDRTNKIVFEGLALTNHPYIKRMEPVKPAQVMNLSEPFARKLDLAASPSKKETMDENQKFELAEAKRQIQELQAKLSETSSTKDQMIATLSERVELMEKNSGEAQKQVRLQQTHAKLSACFRRGKLTVPAYKKAIALTEALIKGGSDVVKMPAGIKLSEGEEIDKLDVIKEVTDLLGELPDAVGVDPGEMELEENQMPAMQGAMNPEEDLLAQADKIQAENPNMPRAKAVSLAAKGRSVTRLRERGKR